MHLLSALLLLLVASAAPTPADWSRVDEHWYILELNGTKAGWMSLIVDADEERYRTVTRTHLSVGRGVAATTIQTTSAFEETRDGRPLVVRYEQTASLDPVASEWRFGDGTVTLRSRQSGREVMREMPAPEGVWLTPQAAERFTAERRKAGAKEITYRMVDPEVGLKPISVRTVYEGEGTFEHDGRTIPVTRWLSTTDLMPIEVLEQYSVDGHMVHSEMNAGIGRLVTRLATKAEAQAPVDGPGPDLLVQTFVRPDRPIANVVRTRQARYRLRAKQGSLPAIPAAGAQRVETGASGEELIVVVDLDDPLAAADGEANDTDYLDESTMIDADDPLIRKLAANAVRRIEEHDVAARAEALRRRVHRHISRKGLQTAFASASETAKTKTGDCSEHAMLLCAMLRAEGIPARVASGLIYVDGFLGERDIFGWHMWTQALVDGHWIDLDATLSKPYHAGHVLTSTASFADGATDRELVSMIMLMGNLRIDVLEVH
ncbi:MAG: transglutaminase-like domain-containing protein [Planctomycetota bacterium]|jgi:transglutaminase-like putative cysteine protease